MDGRRVRGDRTRDAVAAQAAALASLHGLNGVSLARVADALGIGKSSVQAAFATKEELQLAAVSAAAEIFVRAVVAPTEGADDGLPRLVALVDAWLAYVERRVFPGGCFMVATLAEFDSLPGPVRDALRESRRQWLGLLAHHVRRGQRNDSVPQVPSAEAAAFEIDAVLSAANVARNLDDDVAHLATARTLIAMRLQPAE